MVVRGQGTSFVKHLRSKLEALRIYQSTIEHLIQEVENPKKNGLAINSRIPDYLIKLKPSTEEEVQLKKIVGVTELMELQNIGLDTIYALREVPDASPEIIALAQGQIAGGIALLSAFPPAAIITTSIASTMISEGITDIAMELILKGQPGLNWAYAKAKAISYGISIITGCIAKLAQWEKVMKASIKACKSISNVLKKSPVMTKLCTNIADKIEKLGKWLEKVHEVSKFNQLSKVKQLEQLENLRKAGDLEKFTTLGGLKTLQNLQKLEGLGKLKDLSKLHTVAKLTGKAVVSGVKGVATSVAMEKIVIAPLQEIMQGIKPRLKETIKESINKNIDKEAVISATNIEEALIKAHKQTTGEIISEVAYEIALGLTRPYGDWRVKAGYLAVDSILSSYKMYNYTEEFCKKFNENLTKGEVVKNDIEKIIKKLAEQLSETVFGMVVSSTGKIAVNLPGIIKGAAGAAYKKHQKKKEEQIKREQDEIAKLEKDVAQQQQHEAERIKAGKEPKECVGLTLDSLNPAGRSEDGLGPKTQSEVRELIENRLAKDGSKAYEENLGTLNRKEILNALKKHGGSEGMLLLSREDGSIGHAVKVQKVGSKLILVDPQSGKVMDHQQAKAYFSEHNYSKAAVMGVQPAGFKEGIGQKSVRKFKELTGIDAGPGKPFDKDIEFAGGKRQQAEDLPSNPSKQRRFTMDNPDLPKDNLLKDALGKHYKQNCKDFKELLHLSAQLKSKYPNITFVTQEAACLQYGKGFTTKGKELSGDLLAHPVNSFGDVHAAHTIGFGLKIENDHYVKPEDRNLVLAIYHLTQKTNLLPGFINNNGDFDKGKDDIAYKTFCAFIKEGAKSPDGFYKSYLNGMLDHIGQFKKWEPKHYDGPNSISAASLRSKGLKAPMLEECYEAVHKEYERDKGLEEYDKSLLLGDYMLGDHMDL